VSEPEVLLDGVVFGESPRWHDGRLWFSDWGANQVVALGADGGHEVVATVASFPMCIDFLPDGRLLVVDSARKRLLRREPDGSLVDHADLSPTSREPWNDIVVDERGNAYVNSIGFDFPGGEFRLRAQPGRRPAPVRRRPALGRIRGVTTQRSGRGLPRARPRSRPTVTRGGPGRPRRRRSQAAPGRGRRAWPWRG
jgi:sugar lactone lactonase YvrE